ncbi:MAG TPA: NIPSNAP family protein [Candidatus Cybelea sp.]
MINSCSIVELRQYTLHPGQRDTLIELFDREFIEPQELVDMTVIGQFRVLDDPDRFFWLRGFVGMQKRAPGLQAFYGGPVWKAHREAANGTMIDSDDVLLLRPARPASGFLPSSRRRPGLDSASHPARLYVANIYYFREPEENEFVSYFEEAIAPIVSGAGASVCAYFVTERSPNDYRALPVREDENVFVWFAVFPDTAAYDKYIGELSRSHRWNTVLDTLRGRLRAPIEDRRLAPTSRSRLR